VAKTIHKLAALFVGRVKEPGMYADGGGLYLQVTSSGAKSWIFRFEVNGRERAMGLGSLNAIGLSEARTQAEDCRGLRQRDIDPIEHRKEARVQAALDRANTISFAEAATQYIDSHKSGWKNKKHFNQWRMTLLGLGPNDKPATFDYCAALRPMSVAAVDTTAVLKVLQQKVGAGPDAPSLWNTKTETASRIRGRIESVLSWAKAKGQRKGENPAAWRGHLDQLLPAKSKVVKVVHHPALPFADVPTFMPLLRSQKGTSARALEFTILTIARTTETIEAEWVEIDFGARLWTVPAGRMKGEEEHVVPLCARSIEILKDMRKQDPDSKYIFPGRKRGRPLSNMAMSNLLLRMGYTDITVHGFRSSFSDWAGETTNFQDTVIEMSLAHKIEDEVKAAYRRGALLLKRRRLLEMWERYCGSVHKPMVVRMSA
jgi:integrase